MTAKGVPGFEAISTTISASSNKSVFDYLGMVSAMTSIDFLVNQNMWYPYEACTTIQDYIETKHS